MKIKKIKDVNQLALSPQKYIERKYFDKYIELPCLLACQYLYDMNIHTYSSGCNKVNYDNAHIMIYYDELSDENKKIAEELIEKGFGKKYSYNNENFLTIAIKTSLNDDIQKVSDNLLEIVKKFVYQDVLYGFKSKDEFMKENVEFTREFRYVNGDLVPYFINDLNEEELEERKREILFDANESYEYAIDEGRVDLDNEMVWENRELFEKHIEYLECMKGLGKK